MRDEKRKRSGQIRFNSSESIFSWFPKFREGLKSIKGVFEQYDEDSSGVIDRDELKKCLEKLNLHKEEKEIDELFNSCDIDGSKGIQFTEFIVFLCLIYLLMIPSSSSFMVGSTELKETFDRIVDAFLFLDKNGDGKLNKKDVDKSLNEFYPWEKSPGNISKNPFMEMDQDRNGKVGFREFLFALIKWVGIDDSTGEMDSDEEISDGE
ncbi:probable calcium-binding protein CML22 isoform X2 [Mangifera indica]|nr:probable calcium-binding protein CML22 isoform X2 [Mangifera indica]